MPKETPIFRQNHQAMEAFQARAEEVGYKRREMELQISRLEDAFQREVDALDRLRTSTLYGLRDDPEHAADGTPRR